MNRHDCNEAIATLEKLPASDQRSKGVRIITALFASADSEACLDWAAQLPSPTDRNMAGMQLVSLHADAGQLDELTVVVNRLDDAATRSRGISAISTALTRRGGIRELEAWLEQADVSVRDQARAASVGLQVADLAAAERTIENITDEFYRAQARQAVLHALFKTSTPAKAAEWVLAIPSAAEKSDAVFALVNLWEITDRQQLQTWLTALHPGQTKDNALQTLVYRVKATDPQRAMSLALQIGHDGMRRSLQAKLSDPSSR